MINKLTPINKQTTVKIFLINLFPFKLDKWAPRYPPVKEPNIRIANKFTGIEQSDLEKLLDCIPENAL